MLYVSLIVEVLRTRPGLVFWSVVLTQTGLWALVPSLVYTAPPGDLPLVIAVGHEFRLGTSFGPPLAFWLAELCFSAFGIVGVYLLSQVCVVVALYAIFRLGVAVVGRRHATLTTLLMVGVAAFTVPTPEFGPRVLLAPIWATMLLHYWRAVGEGRRDYWFALALAAGLLLLTSLAGLILLALLAVFTFANKRGRAAFRQAEPWLAATAFAVIVAPYAWWLLRAGQSTWPQWMWPDPGHMLRLIGLIVAAHAGVAALAVLALGWPTMRRAGAIALSRLPVDPLARALVFTLAIAPALTATLLAAAWQQASPVGGVAVLSLATCLALILTAGDTIHVHSRRILSFAWLGLLFVPPLMAFIGVLLVPRIVGAELQVIQPAEEIARGVAESYQRRVGTPLAVVGGDTQLAALVAMHAPSRPRLLLPDDVTLPLATKSDLARQGGVLLWPATDARGAPPAPIVAQFPDLTADMPLSIDRFARGVLGLYRVGWAVVRPQTR